MYIYTLYTYYIQVMAFNGLIITTPPLGDWMTHDA